MFITFLLMLLIQTFDRVLTFLKRLVVTLIRFDNIQDEDNISVKVVEGSTNLYGTIEMQPFNGEEIHLLTQFNSCVKNPGHKNFIPIKKFSMKHLPEGYHDTDLYEVVKATADLTVRVCVNKVSLCRPKFWPNTKTPYPLCLNGKAKQMNESRTGTGELFVYKYIKGQGYDGYNRTVNEKTGEIYKSKHKTCPCEKCKQSDQPNNVWWEIYVSTAAHVVFDAFEARHTSIELFYDEKDCKVVKLDNICFNYVKMDEDEFELRAINCGELGRRLFDTYVRYNDLWRKVDDKYWNRPDNKLIFIVSHPHGFSKHVSFGQMVNNNKVGDFNDKFDLTIVTYTADTCAGTSGATVHFVGNYGDHLHTGSLENGLNYSGISVFYRK